MNIQKHGLKYLNTTLLVIIIQIIIIIPCITYKLKAQQSEKLFLAPAKDYVPAINKFLFYSKETPAYGSSQSDKQKEIAYKILRIESDSTENSIEFSYNSTYDPEPVKLVVKVKDKDKRITITIYNMLANKVSDVYSGIPGTNELEIENFKEKISSLANGVYICVLQGNNFREKEKFIISR